MSTDGELFQTFEMCYDYNLFALLNQAMRAPKSSDHYIKTYAMMVRFQQTMYPQHASKMRFVENHDTPRINGIVRRQIVHAYTALVSFLPGAFLIHSGQESDATRTPSLFEKVQN
jgi:hypothetical protein